ncbi:MAG: sensor histidine kinase, partial [Chitinophagaceae bacterium]
INAKRQQGRIFYNAGLIYTNLTRYDSAIFYLNEAEKMALLMRDTNLLVNIYNANALLSNYQSDYKTAVEFLTKAATLVAESKNIVHRDYLPQVYGNMGHNLIAEKQLQKGILYEKKALLFANYPDEKRYRLMLHLDITDAYIKLNDLGLAKPHLDSARIIALNLNNPVLKTMQLNTEGAYFAATNDNARSLQAYLISYRIADSMKNEFIKSECADNVAKAYLKTGSLDLAEQFAWTANKISTSLSSHSIRASTYETLKTISSLRKNYQQAFQFSEMQKLYADSATSDASQKSSLYLEARYQSVKNENDISALTISNTNKEIEVFKRNRLLLIGGLFSSALLILLGLLYRNSRQKRSLAEKDAALQQEQVKFLERQQQVLSLQSMVNGQETERTRIAKDLHDGLGGLFSTIKMYFSTLQHEQPQLKEDALFIKSYEMVNTASEEVRRIAHNMMPEVLIKIGLLQAVQELCNSISAGKLLTVTLQSYGVEKRLNASTEIMLFRIIQELLNNIIKHAHASEAIIQFNKEENRLSVIVEDNGRGFNTLEKETTSQAGLASVESRVSYLNGKLSIDSQQESGTTVMMDFLLNENYIQDSQDK